jgi:hypothetical protein
MLLLSLIASLSCAKVMRAMALRLPKIWFQNGGRRSNEDEMKGERTAMILIFYLAICLDYGTIGNWNAKPM